METLNLETTQKEIRTFKKNVLSNLERSLIGDLKTIIDVVRYNDTNHSLINASNVSTNFNRLENYICGIYDGFLYNKGFNQEIETIKDFFRNNEMDEKVMLYRVFSSVENLVKTINNRLDEMTSFEISENEAHLQNF